MLDIRPAGLADRSEEEGVLGLDECDFLWAEPIVDDGAAFAAGVSGSTSEPFLHLLYLIGDGELEISICHWQIPLQVYRQVCILTRSILITVSPKRDQLLETAGMLFYRDGYHATGIDRILAEAGIAKMTLYSHFRSKEDLILAVLKKRDQTMFESLNQFLDAKRRSPEKLLEAVFDWLVVWIGSKGFRGCAFLKAMAEYQNLNDPIHQAALAHRSEQHL